MSATLLFLPGTLCDARLWQPQMTSLSNHWPTAVADYRYAESISAMAALALSQTTGSVIPIGLSMGGIVALEIWRQAPQRVTAMALFDTDPGGDTPARCTVRDAQILAATHGEFRNVIKTQLKPVYFSPANNNNAAMRRNVIEMAQDQGIGAFAAQLTALATRQDSWTMLKNITVPTLVACGTDDQICTPELHQRLAAAIPQSTFAQIESAGHLVSLEQPAATTAILRAWLDQFA